MSVQSGPLLASLLIAGLALTGCASEGGGLVAGPMAEPAPFVVESRPATAEYPAVGLDAPAREDRVLTEEERAKLEAELKALSARRRATP